VDEEMRSPGSLAGVSALSFLQCFATVGWERHPAHMKPLPLISKGSRPGKVDGANREEPAAHQVHLENKAR